MNIKTFACDHRDLSKSGIMWNFPFERLGTGFMNDCVLKDVDGESICTEDTNKFLSEYTSIWWLWKHYAEIGDPDCIGFIHYRRFFMYPLHGMQQLPLYSIKPYGNSIDNSILKLIPDDAQLYAMLASAQYDGILPRNFPDYGYYRSCKDVIDLMYAESCYYDLRLGFTYEMCKSMFDVLREAMLQCFQEDVVNMSYAANSTFHFNIFILKRELFFMYNDIMCKTVQQCMKLLQQSRAMLVDRALSYVIERFSSCIFIAMAISKKAKFGMLPLLVLENKEFLK